MAWSLSKRQTEETLLAVDRQRGLFMFALENDHLLLSEKIKKDTMLIRQGVDVVRRDVQSVESKHNVQDYGNIKLSELSEEIRNQRLADWTMKRRKCREHCRGYLHYNTRQRRPV